jgi:hypothetical protein
MKKILLYTIIILELSLIKVPEYIELNNLAIIEEIGIIEKNNKYTIILKEIIPIKSNQGINYKYKYYKETASTVDKALTNLINQTKKKLYLNKTKSLITNMTSTENTIKRLDIKPKTIIHTNDNINEIIKN